MSVRVRLGHLLITSIWRERYKDSSSSASGKQGYGNMKLKKGGQQAGRAPNVPVCNSGASASAANDFANFFFFLLVRGKRGGNVKSWNGWLNLGRVGQIKGNRQM